ncbi:MAG: hypothetical protein HFH41_01660 [Lachnospiraceae bacterium]|nr:hypothetical protein [Lachnospiraceae bacterium]
MLNILSVESEIDCAKEQEEQREPPQNNLFESWKRFGRRQQKTTLERQQPGDSVIIIREVLFLA